MKEEIQAVFDVLQKLDMKPTQNNVTIMNAVFNSLRKVYQELEEMENVRDSENGSTPDPE